MKDKRPDPKPRKLADLRQVYTIRHALVELRKAMTLRVRDADKGKANLDAKYEKDIMVSMKLDKNIDDLTEAMIDLGAMTGPIWHWGTSIKGLGAGSMLAQLLALIDDISKIPTISKLWRLSGWGVYPHWVNEKGKVMAPRDGYQFRNPKKGEWALYGELCEPGTPGAVPATDHDKVRHLVVTKPKPGWKLENAIDRRKSPWLLPYNNDLKSLCWLIVSQFIKQQTPVYVDYYYERKARQREKHPEPVKTKNGVKFSDDHLHKRAMRETAKLFLKHVWIVWRSYEGLPISEAWIENPGDGKEHTPQPPPPNFPVERYPLPLKA